MTTGARAWIALAACAILTIAALGLVSWRAASLSSERDRAQSEAALEDAVRLALWRLDSAAAALLAGESARPAEAYMAELPDAGGFSVAVKARFSQTSLGGLDVNPRQASREIVRKQAVLLAANDGPAPSGGARLQDAGNNKEAPPPEERKGADWAKDDNARSIMDLSMKRSSSDYKARTKAVEQVQKSSTANQAYGFAEPETASDKAPVKAAVAKPQAKPGAFRETWIGGDLYLVRDVRTGDATTRQGAWVTWRALEPLLAAEIKDLLPFAKLRPLGDAAGDPLRRLAALAIGLEPGPLPASDRLASAGIGGELAVAWTGALLALVATALLLFGTIRLSERRAAFVSSVTHELRTPLTTFRLYTDMLSSGMLVDDGKRTKYLDTLRREAERLTHLVENVLAYSRVEQGRNPPKPTSIAIGQLLERIGPRLVERGAQAGLVVKVAPVNDGVRVLAEPVGLEQVLFNLVDNAAKYAKNAADPSVEVTTEALPGQCIVRVRDHGQGLGELARRDLFVPFAKSAERAAESAPGVGLGLALSRRLVQAMGGGLRYRDAVGGGAEFEIVMKTA